MNTLRAGIGIVFATTLLAGAGAAGEALAAPASDAQVEQGILGPAGYKALTLGMPEDRAVATGLIVNPQTIGSCQWYYLAPSEGPQNPGNGVVLSPARGVVSIPGTETSRTPEGVTMGSVDDSNGSLFDEVKRAYPDLAIPPGAPDFIYEAATPGNATAHYRFAFGEDHKVKDMSLTSNDDGECGLSSSRRP